MKTYKIAFRVAKHEGIAIPCLFIPELPANYGEIQCFDNEGLNSASLEYYRKTKPAKQAEHIKECQRLLEVFSSMGEPSKSKLIKRIQHFDMLNSWSKV